MTSFSADRSYARELDAADPLAGFRDRFAWPGERLIYLDGNSLGPLPLATRARIAEVVNYVRSHFGNQYTDKITAAKIESLPHPIN